MSVYDIADHPDFRFRTTDIVIRIGNAEDGAPHKEDEVGRPARPLQYLSMPPEGAPPREGGPWAQNPVLGPTTLSLRGGHPTASIMTSLVGCWGPTSRAGETEGYFTPIPSEWLLER